MMENKIPPITFFNAALKRFQQTNDSFAVVSTITHAGSDGKHGRPQPPPHLAEQQQQQQPLNSQLLILDSSFNPPTIAHLRMIISALQMVSSSQESSTRRLLLVLSITNADKAPQPAGAFAQRLGMMHAFAHDVLDAIAEAAQAEKGEGKEDEEEGGNASIAVDVCLAAQPYFHDKSAAIASSGCYTTTAEGEGEVERDRREAEQIFLAGYDTLIRIFNPKYYTTTTALPDENEEEDSGQGETGSAMQVSLDPLFRRARLLVTLRAGDAWGDGEEQRAYVDDLLNGNGLEKVGGRREWSERIQVVDDNVTEGGNEVVSSTRVRAAVEADDRETLAKLVPRMVRRWVEREELYRS